MQEQLYPGASKELARKRAQLAPQASAAFKAFGAAVFADGALPRKTKELIAVAAAHVTQCPYCIRGHAEAALKAGATEQEVRTLRGIVATLSRGKGKSRKSPT